MKKNIRLRSLHPNYFLMAPSGTIEFKNHGAEIDAAMLDEIKAMPGFGSEFFHDEAAQKAAADVVDGEEDGTGDQASGTGGDEKQDGDEETGEGAGAAAKKTAKKTTAKRK